MAFSIHVNPHHVEHPSHGWLTADHLDAMPHLLEHLGEGQGERIRTHGGPPEKEYPHLVEVDCSTGWVGYTRATPEDLEELRKQGEQMALERAAADAVTDARLKSLRDKAKEDSGFAALLEHLGVDVGNFN